MSVPMTRADLEAFLSLPASRTCLYAAVLRVEDARDVLRSVPDSSLASSFRAALEEPVLAISLTPDERTLIERVRRKRDQVLRVRVRGGVPEVLPERHWRWGSGGVDGWIRQTLEEVVRTVDARNSGVRDVITRVASAVQQVMKASESVLEAAKALRQAAEEMQRAVSEADDALARADRALQDAALLESIRLMVGQKTVNPDYIYAYSVPPQIAPAVPTARDLVWAHVQHLSRFRQRDIVSALAGRCARSTVLSALRALEAKGKVRRAAGVGEWEVVSSAPMGEGEDVVPDDTAAASS